MCVYRALGPEKITTKAVTPGQGRSVPFGSSWGRRRRQVSDGRASPQKVEIDVRRALTVTETVGRTDCADAGWWFAAVEVLQ